jgi:hypothetical protein
MSETLPLELTEVPSSGGLVVENDVVVLPSLTSEEDTFCLAVVEYGGNLKFAYQATFGQNVANPAARARTLMARPEIVARTRELMGTITENALISIGSHLVELADIRDLAKATGQLKTALSAEEARGRVAGFYIGKDGANSKHAPGNTVVMVSVTTNHDQNI